MASFPKMPDLDVDVYDRAALLIYYAMPIGWDVGSVPLESQAASIGARFTQPWLLTLPKSSCQ